MTFYFDDAIKRLSSAATPSDLEEVDIQVVRDVSICSEMECFPETLRAQANLVILDCSAACTPVNHPGPCYESWQDHQRGLMKMVGALHSIFHALAEARINGFGDDPRTPLNIIYSNAEARREQLARIPR